MRFNHLNLCVDQLDEARDFFATFLDFQFVEQKGEAIVVMSDGHGFTLVLSHLRTAVSKPQQYPDGFHVGFIVETPQQVDQVYQRLTLAPVELAHEPRNIRNTYTFYFTALNGILFEVSSPL
jgi:catechol 2,3-dioxygenase-like lactoylglutathione lyase family enzyme